MKVEIVYDDKYKGHRAVKWHFYDRDYKEIGFEEYCQMTDNNTFTNDDFRKGFKLLLQLYAIEFKA